MGADCRWAAQYGPFIRHTTQGTDVTAETGAQAGAIPGAAATDGGCDAQAQVAQLWAYPVKSCAGVALRESLLIETGLDLDRAFMVVDGAGEFVTQREQPRLALVRPTVRLSDMILRAPGMLALHVSLQEVEQPTRVTVWGDRVAAYDLGAVAAQWFSDYLAQPGLRLVRFDPEQQPPRLSSRQWTGEDEAPNQFSDGYPVLVLSDASLHGLNQRLLAAGHAAVGIERFRPNLVLSGLEAHDEDRIDTLEIDTDDGPLTLRLVKPCPRCPMPNIDPATALASPEVGDALQAYRADPRVDGALSFGMNAIVTGLTDGRIERTLRVGQTVRVRYRWD